MIDHLCAPTQVGRCPSPYCGIGVDSGIITSGSQLRKIAGDPWEETEEYIRSGHREPPETGECRTMALGDGIKAVVCNYGGKWEIQSYLFPKGKFTMEEAKAWFETHKDQKDTPEFAIHEADAGSGQPEKPCPIVAKITELNPEGFAKLMRERFSTSELSRLFAPVITQLAASSSPAAPAASNGNTAPAIPPVLQQQQQANKAGQQAAPTAAVSPTAAINVPSTTSGAAQLPGTGMGGNATVEELSALTQEVIERAKRLNPDPSSEL